MGSRWPGSQVNLQESDALSALHPILYFLLPLQVGSDLSEKPSPESTGVWRRRTLSHWATLARRRGEGAQLLSCRSSSASPVHVLLPSSWPASTRSPRTHVRSLLIEPARRLTGGWGPQVPGPVLGLEKGRSRSWNCSLTLRVDSYSEVGTKATQQRVPVSTELAWCTPSIFERGPAMGLLGKLWAGIWSCVIPTASCLEQVQSMQSSLALPQGLEGTAQPRGGGLGPWQSSEGRGGRGRVGPEGGQCR